MLPRVKAGELRDRVTIQAVTTAADPYGELTETWADVATVFAEIVFEGGSEPVNAQQARALANWRVRIRHRRDVTPGTRLIVAETGQVFTIASVGPNDSKKHELVCKCSELVDLAEAETP
jgi:SPP1 family predicted phage head-tail adaptor